MKLVLQHWRTHKMANTKIPSELSSTPSISDSGTANAITITSGNVVQTNRAIQSTHNQAIRINGYGTLGQTSSGQMTVLGHNVETSSSVANTLTTINGSWHGHAIRMYYDEGISFHTTDSTVNAGTTIFDASTNPYERMKLKADGTGLWIGDTAANSGKVGRLQLTGRGDSSSGEVHVGSIYAHHANADYLAARIKFDASSTVGNIQFLTSTGGSLSTAMKIQNDGDVSIGTTSNSSQLHVVSDQEAICTFEGSNSTGVVINSYSGVCSIIGYDRGAGAYNDLEIRGSSGDSGVLYFDGSTNRIGLGLTNPTNKFHIKGSGGEYVFYCENGNGNFKQSHGNSSFCHFYQSGASSGFYFGSACQANGGFSTYSDERLKEDITTIDGALDKVALMNGVSFTWKDKEKRGEGKQFGVTAQNMLEVDSELPKLVEDADATNEEIENKDIDTQYYSMDYSRLTPYFIEAIKELKTKLEAAEARITELEG